MKTLTAVALCGLLGVSAAEAVPAPRTIEPVYVLFGGNPASATPAPNLTHSYGENPAVDAATRVSWVNGDWGFISYGQMSQIAVLGTVYGYVTVPLDTTVCSNPGDVAAQNMIAAAADKLLPARANASVIRWYYIPAGISCGNSHPNFPFGFVSHEFGHSLGLGHEHDMFFDGTTTSTAEYGSRSVMGGQGNNLGAEMKDSATLGIFNSTYSIVTAAVGTGPADVKLTAFDVASPGIKALRVMGTTVSCSPFVPPPNNCTTIVQPQYYVEFRPGRQGGSNEVLIHKVGNYLLDLDTTSGVRYGMKVGESLCYAEIKGCITLVGYGPEPTAEIQVTFNAPHKPSRPVAARVQ